MNKVGIFLKPHKIGKRKKENPCILVLFFKKGKKKSRTYISGVIHACFVDFFGYLLILKPPFSSYLFFVWGEGGGRVWGQGLAFFPSFTCTAVWRRNRWIYVRASCAPQRTRDCRLATHARSLTHTRASERERENQRDNRDF